jgi:O-antigen/teichoic acid export membrane protein
MLRFSLPQTFTALMFFAILWTDTLLLGASRSLAEVGVYTIVGSLLQPATLVATAIGQMFAPRIAAEDARGDRATLGVMLKRVTYWNTAVSIPLFAMLAVIPGALLALFGPRYVSGAYALAILSIGQLINTCAGPLGQLINMSGRPYITAVNNAFVALLNLVMCAVLIPKYGMTGAACSTATALTLANLIKLVQVRVIFRLSPFRSSTVRTLLAIAVASAVALAMKPLPWPNALAEVVAISSVLMLVYGAVMWRFGTSAEDRELLVTAWRRIKRRAVRATPRPQGA